MKLKEAIGHLAGIAPSRSANPVLTHIWLGGRDGELVGRASNGEVDLTIRLESELDMPEPRLVPVEGFHRFISGLADPHIEFDAEQHVLAVRSGSARAQFHTADPADFPAALDPDKEDARFKTMASQLRAALAVRYAASSEDYRAIFRGVQFEKYETGLRAVASDGFRLAVYDTPDRDGEREQAWVVPRKALDLMAKLLPDGDELIEVAFGRGHMHLTWDGVRFVAALMEGQFPEYERVVPADYPNYYEVVRSDLIAALKRMTPLVDRQTARVDLEFDSRAVRITAEGDYGRAQDQVLLEESHGEPITAIYNLHYMLEALQHLETEENDVVTIQLSGAATPSLVKGQTSWAIVVPLRV